VNRREFVGALGGGILVLLAEDDLEAQESGRRSGGGRTPDALSAWLHIGEDGRVTVYTGKVEVGQNTRTALTQAVAEELRSPIGSIRLIMGDTDLTLTMPAHSGAKVRLACRRSCAKPRQRRVRC
jgi:isoquinoline 1-oxidoreductase